MTEFPIAKLVFDAQLWPRVERDEARVAHLADVLTAGGRLPAVKIQRKTAVVLGGWHTVAAYQRLRRETVPVETVDVDDADRLLYAYREDAEAALPYTNADAKSVAQRLYQCRSNGHGANVAEIARDLGRAQKTVEDWVCDLVAADNARERLHRLGRAVAIHALLGAKCQVRRIGELLSVGKSTVSRDSETAIAGLITDPAVVAMARGFIAETATRGSTAEERQRASDWLLEQVDPSALHYARQLRALNSALDWVRPMREQLARIATTDLAGVSNSDHEDVRARRGELVTELESIRRITQTIEGSTV